MQFPLSSFRKKAIMGREQSRIYLPNILTWKIPQSKIISCFAVFLCVACASYFCSTSFPPLRSSCVETSGLSTVSIGLSFGSKLKSDFIKNIKSCHALPFSDYSSFCSQRRGKYSFLLRPAVKPLFTHN